MEFTEKQLERFWKKVNKKTEDGCWEWTASKGSNGYGQFAVNGVAKSTHRISYIISNGNIPEGMMICHKCNNRLCVNPKHLYVGTGKDNISQAVVEKRLYSQNKTHCKAGHEFTEENTVLRKQKKRGYSYYRVCLTCKHLSDKKRKQRPEYQSEYWKKYKGIPKNLRDNNKE